VKFSAADAVANLRPNVPFVMYDDDLTKLIWHTENVQPLTAAEVAAEVQRLEAEAVTAAEAVAAGQAAAVAHAKSLGFTDEMIAGMWPGLGGAL